MIVVGGVEYGTADELAAALGPDVTPDLVRSWARPRSAGVVLARHHVPGRGRGTTYYPLAQAAEIERRTRLSQRGRPRGLDDGVRIG